MERRYNLRTKAPPRVNTGNTIQHFRPQHYVPPAGVPPSSDMHSLRQALLSAEGENLKLASENARLKQQFANLQEATTKLLHENGCLQKTLGRKLNMAKQNIKELQKALEAIKADQDEDKKREETLRENEKELPSLRESLRVRTEEHLDISSQLSLKEIELSESSKRCNALDEKFREELAERERREMELSSLRDSLSAEKEKTDRVRDFWIKEYDQMKAAFEGELKMVKSMCDTQQSTDLQQVQADAQSKVSQLQETITEKDNEISAFRSEIKSLTEEHLILSSQLSLKETELDQSINRCNALEKKFKKELVEREQSWERRQKDMEKLWAEKEVALMEKASNGEEELKLLIVKSIHLQSSPLKRRRGKVSGAKRGKKAALWRRRLQVVQLRLDMKRKRKIKKTIHGASGAKRKKKATLTRRLQCVWLRLDRTRRERRRNGATGAGLARRKAVTEKWRKLLFLWRKMDSSELSILHPPRSHPHPVSLPFPIGCSRGNVGPL
ncbi:probable DNA double-strand break repair Rad50 ATPase isoform X2 [Xiphias gladius]|uniref:probable DNA double-strand break repair Rad50 ATPase isoform X2 n=1 Tax=Xiphias gladius TaxID=8245 RepID=UPI001A9859B4|nr:probable DNA double-strand break repair Rad50 ATPase isoform X2 [Xiphias gladius]